MCWRKQSKIFLWYIYIYIYILCAWNPLYDKMSLREQKDLSVGSQKIFAGICFKVWVGCFVLKLRYWLFASKPWACQLFVLNANFQGFRNNKYVSYKQWNDTFAWELKYLFLSQTFCARKSFFQKKNISQCVHKDRLFRLFLLVIAASFANW